jgi:hypothetical protein
MVEEIWINEGWMIVNKEAYFQLLEFKNSHEKQWEKWRKKNVPRQK